MKTKLAFLLAIGLNTCCVLAGQPADAGAGDLAAPLPTNGGEMEPVGIAEQASLTAVINYLGRQTDLNIQIDPAVKGGVAADGKPIPEPMVEPFMYRDVTPLGALKLVLETYGLQIVVVDEESPKNVIVKRKDPNALPPLVLQTFVLHYQSPTNLAAVIKSTIVDTRAQVIAESKTSQLVVRAAEKDMKGVQELIAVLDLPPKQVLIEARLFETSRNPETIKGIDWSGTFAAQTLTFGNGNVSATSTESRPGATTTSTLPSGRTLSSTASMSQVSQAVTTMDPLSGIIGMNAGWLSGWNPQTAFLNAQGVTAVLSFLNQDSESEVLSNPRAVTLDNEEATLEVTRSFPIFTQNPGSAQVAATTQVLYTNVGTILRVKPRISANNEVTLRVEPEVSDIAGQSRQIINGSINEANIYAARRITTNVRIPSGNTLVMGGLVSDSSTSSSVKVPILGDIPGIGFLFRREGKSQEKINLLIFVTPTIVKNEDFVPTETDFLKTPVPDVPDFFDKTAWDSAKRHDWTKPVW